MWRGPQRHPHGICLELHIVPTICWWCCYILVYMAINMFMLLQVVVLLSYRSHKFCVAINWSTKTDLKNHRELGWNNLKFYANLIKDVRFDMCKISSTIIDSVTLSNMMLLYKMITIYRKHQFELPSFLFSGNYRSPSFAFQHQYLS